MRSDDGNGWLAIFRVVTPALIGVVLWIVTTGRADTREELADIRDDLKTLSNDYLHELSAIKERLGRIEARNQVVNNVGEKRR